jgi:hypothetical protein
MRKNVNSPPSISPSSIPEGFHSKLSTTGDWQRVGSWYEGRLARGKPGQMKVDNHAAQKTCGRQGQLG